MANLVNSTPLNVPAPLKASAPPIAVPSAPPVLEARAPQLAVAAHTAGKPGFATPHTALPVTAVLAHTTIPTTYANATQTKDK